jgi:hypothetical protein
MNLSSTQFHLEGPSRDRVMTLSQIIPASDLTEKGRCTTPHVTARFGLHTQDHEDVRDAVHGFGPVPMVLGRVSCFPAGPDRPYDVVKVDVGGDRLRKLNSVLGKLPHTDSFSEYRPHATIAYVRPGCGAKYAELFAPLSMPFVGRALVFSNPLRQHTRIDLGDQPTMQMDEGDPVAPSSPPGKLPLDEVAPAGADGRRVAELLEVSKDQGSRVLEILTRRALTRLIKSGDPRNAKSLFDEHEMRVLGATIAKTTATANLLGRSRVRERMTHVEGKRSGVLDFAESNAFVKFVDPPPPLAPIQAVDYFRSLVPDLGSISANAFGANQERRAFTMAVKADQVLLDRVKGIILDRLQSGRAVNTAPATIQSLLDGAGVAPTNPQYAEMVFRTNMMDAYNEGAHREMQDPDVKNFFPVWQYLGILDGRQGEDHRPHFDLYYPSTVDFREIRGPRVYNCRCSFRSIDQYEWEDLQRNGVRVQSS